jgi:hypothetical protein
VQQQEQCRTLIATKEGGYPPPPITLNKASPFSDLPRGILAHAANFLAPPSRALFAVALDESSAASHNERSSAIAGNQWDVLDFGLIEKELASKLCDDHIEAVLLCIDAVNKLKRLKLTNCVNITGAGLEPLRGSAIIEQIDLSLVGEHQSPRFRTEPTIISCDHALPILDSIIEREGFALKYLQFPHVWRAEPPTWWSVLCLCTSRTGHYSPSWPGGPSSTNFL